MNFIKKILTKLREKSVKEAIARCDAISVYEFQNLFPPFFYLLNDKKTVREVEKYGLKKLSEAVKRAGQEEKRMELSQRQLAK